MLASVSVIGNRVVATLGDGTTHQLFQKTLHAAVVDVSSADWVLEAPSDCITATACQTLPLADFHSATFSQAQAASTTGHTGAISDPGWDTTKIELTPGGRRFAVYTGSGAAAGSATPSGLSASGTSFGVIFTKVSVLRNAFLSQRRAPLQAGYLVHARLWRSPAPAPRCHPSATDPSSPSLQCGLCATSHGCPSGSTKAPE